jgi:hypothetical protein
LTFNALRGIGPSAAVCTKINYVQKVDFAQLGPLGMEREHDRLGTGLQQVIEHRIVV